MEIKLAEALLRRKELTEKLRILSNFKDNHVFYQVRANRVKVTDGIDELSADFPKMTASQVTAEYDHVAKQLRLIDAHIQQANWTCILEVDQMIMNTYSETHSLPSK